MSKTYILLFLFLVNSIVFSQKLILEELPEKILQEPIYGLKGKHFVFAFYEFNLLGNSKLNDTITIAGFRSSVQNVGLRYKLKLASKMSLITDFSYRYKSAFINQKDNRFPDTLFYTKERINFNQICLAAAFRFLYSRKNIFFGKHIDLGFTAAYNFSSSRITKQTITTVNSQFNKQTIKNYERHLNYIFPFEVDPFISFGFEKFQFKFQYRITDSFTNINSINIGDLPRFIFGVNMSLIGT